MNKHAKCIFVMILCVSSLQGMNYFTKKVENFVANLRGKNRISSTHITPVTQHHYNDNPDDLGKLVTGHFFDRVYDLIQKHQFSEEIINKSYQYVYNQHVTYMPLLATAFVSYGNHYGFQKNSAVDWTLFLKELLFQQHIHYDFVVDGISINHNETCLFSPLYLLLFGAVDLKRDVFGKSDRVKKVTFALEALEILLELRIKFNPVQGITIDQISGNKSSFYSIFDCLKNMLPNFMHSPESKKLFNDVLECLVKLGVDTDIMRTYCYPVYEYVGGRVILPVKQGHGKVGFCDITKGITDTTTLKLLYEYKNMMEKSIAKRPKSLGALVQNPRQRPLMNVRFRFC